MFINDDLIDKAKMNDHWLGFDLNFIKKVFKIGADNDKRQWKTFICPYKAYEYIEELEKQRDNMHSIMNR